MRSQPSFQAAVRQLFVGLAAASGLLANADEPAWNVLPGSVVLDGPNAAQRLVVQDRREPPFTRDATSQATFVSSNTDVCEVSSSGIVRAKSDGQAAVTVTVSGHSIEIPVTVRRASSSDGPSFRRDVQTVFTRSGCNMGACHGAQAGKRGFKLSLRGYDPWHDHDVLTRQSRGRRIDLEDPGRSLILMKATGAVPHGGGTRFETDSEEYRIVSTWIADGAPPPRRDDPAVTGLDILPAAAVVSKGESHQLLVQATYADGSVRDVTHWVKFASTEAGVASVNDEGLVTVAGYGETAVTVWFGSRVAVSTIASPFPNAVDAEAFAAARRGQRGMIDEKILDKLERLRLPPSPPASDGEFLRRVYLDTLGVLPTAVEAAAFLDDPSTTKRQDLLERLFERPEYVDYWAYKWSDLLLLNSNRLREPAVWAFYQWIREAVRSNMPWNEFARQVVTARGSTLDHGAANFFVLHKDPQQLTETTCVTFLGLSITCARCHDHPLERWTLDDYYGMANLFARVRLKDTETDGETIVYAADTGDVQHPTRLTIPVPRPLDGAPLDPQSAADRRVALADWLTAPENPYFSRALVNRVWANYMGRGLVEAVDDLRATNPSTNEELLTALAEDFETHGYDLRRLIRAIVSSNAYQRSAATTPANADDDRFYSHFLVRRMTAEVLLDALSQVTGVPSEFPGQPPGTRALQLPDSNVASLFLTSFGRPVREFPCECERTEDPTVTQMLHLANGKTLNEKLAGKNGVLDRWLAEETGDAELLDRLFLSALARRPSPAQRQAILESLAAADAAADEAARAAARRAAWEDLFWGVLTSKEFVFVH